MISWGRACGVPYLRPEIVLLFKAEPPRAIDDQDFGTVVGLLDTRSRDWLARAVALCHPEHKWLDVLNGQNAG